MDTIEAFHWSDIDKSEWKWPHFSPREMACRGTGELIVSVELLDALEQLRTKLGNKPLIVTSAYRTPEHNKRVGGAKDSRHVKGDCVDLALGDHNGATVEAVAESLGFTGIGRYPDRGFIHLDMRPGEPARWGKDWPDDPEFVPFAPEPPQVVENVRKTREVKAAEVAAAGGTVAVISGAIADFAPALPVLRQIGDWVKESPGMSLMVLGGLTLTTAGYVAWLRFDDWRSGRR